jgi:hypothetical protein
MPTPIPLPSSTPTPSSTHISSPTATSTLTSSPSPSPTVPEFPSWTIILVTTVLVLSAASILFYKKANLRNNSA